MAAAAHGGWCGAAGSSCTTAVPAPGLSRGEMGHGSPWTKSRGFGDRCARAWARQEHEAEDVPAPWPWQRCGRAASVGPVSRAAQQPSPPSASLGTSAAGSPAPPRPSLPGAAATEVSPPCPQARAGLGTASSTGRAGAGRSRPSSRVLPAGLRRGSPGTAAPPSQRPPAVGRGGRAGAPASWRPCRRWA